MIDVIEQKVCVELQLFAAGYCRHPEFLTLSGGRIRPVAFPAGFALIRHPQQGYILFDTGYSSRFFAETRRLPQLLYKLITPVTFREENSAINQLAQFGIAAADIGYVVLSHFHADHTAGLRDFPYARLIYKREAYTEVARLGTLAAVKAGYLSGLLPEDLTERSRFIEEMPRYSMPAGFPYAEGYDLFGDGSLIAIDLPGHAPGQIGLLLNTAEGTYFLCADAVWSSRAYRENRKPHAAARIIMHDTRAYDDTFHRLVRLHREYPQICIVPSHCREALVVGNGEEAL